MTTRNRARGHGASSGYDTSSGRLRTVQVLEESERRLRSIFDAMFVFVAMIDLEGHILEVNLAPLEAAGLKRADVLGQSVADSYWFSHSPEMQAQVRRDLTLAALGEIVRREYSILAQGGRTIAIDTMFSPLRNDAGQVTDIVACAIDITERKQAEDVAARRTTQLQTALSLAKMGVWLSDLRTGAISSVEPGGPISGLPPEETPKSGVEFRALIHPDDRARVSANVDRARQGQQYDAEFRIVRADGSIRWVAARGCTIPDEHGKPAQLMGSDQDITAHKLAELRIRQLNRTYVVLSGINQLIVRERTFERILEGACRIAVEEGGFLLAWVGLNDTPEVGLRIAAHAGATPDTLEILEGFLRTPELGCSVTARSLATGQHTICNDIANYAEAANWREAAIERGYRAMASFPFVIGGAVAGTFNLYAGESLFFDADEVRLLSNLSDDIAFAMEASKLEHERRQLAKQLAESQKMDAIGQLASGIAHDFNNLLGTILGNANLARMDLAPGHPSLESIEEIRRAGHRASELVQRILTFGRPQDHRLVPLQLGTVVEEAVRLLRATLPAGIELNVKQARSLPDVSADAGQIHQIVMNLVTNAWHAIGERRGRISIELSASEPDEELRQQRPDLRPEPYVLLSVSDTGCGMDAATRSHIFEPFFTNKPAGRGTGLGLSVVQGIVQSHGGAIAVDTQPGGGSTFRLYFPPEASLSQPVPVAAPSAAEAQGSGQRVLYVDDEEPLVYLFVRLLKRLGYAATGYSSPTAALDAFRADPDAFDLVISDMNMPELSGLDLARQIVASRPGVNVVLVSGYLRPAEMDDARALGVREVILKPNTVDELVPIVQRLLAAHR